MGPSPPQRAPSPVPDGPPPTLELGAGPVRLGLLGDPVAHSLSPVLHAAAAASAGLTVEYPLLRTPEAALPDRLAALRAAGHRGVNLTAPLKVAVRRHLQGESAAARRLGAVNTVLFGADGALWGDNTDLAGFAWQLSRGATPPGAVVVLGAGGAARAVLAALTEPDRRSRRDAPARPDRARAQVTVLARRVGAAEALAARFGPAGGLTVTAGALDTLADRLPDVGLLISCLPAAAAPGLAALDWARAPAALRFIDLGYAAPHRDLVQRVRATGRSAEDGLAMLAAQGVAAFARFVGVEVSPDAVWPALRAAAAERASVGVAGPPGGAPEPGDPTA